MSLKRKPLAHELQLKSGRLWLFDSALAGAAKLDDIDSDYGTLEAELEAGRYAVEVLGEAGPTVYVHLKKQ